MNYRVRFTNKSVRKIQIAVIGNQTENFQIDAGETDSTVLIPVGTAFTFYWRDDDSPCTLCYEALCYPNNVTMPGEDVSIVLPDPAGRWPKQTV